MNSGFICDTSDFDKLILRLTGKEMKKAKKKALRKGSRILVKGGLNEMRSSRFKYRGWMDKAIKFKVHRSGNSSTVHLFGELGDSKKDRGIVRYLEVGTSERYRSRKTSYRGIKRITQIFSGRKKGYSGKIRGYGFFEKARSGLTTQVQNEMSTTLESEIRKISFLNK